MAANGLTKDDFVKTFEEWDGAGMGLLKEKQVNAALSELTLPFTAEEVAQHIAIGKQVTGDSSGKIKLVEFATYLAFEVVKKNASQPKPKPQPQQQQQQQGQQQQGNGNPFDMFGFDDNKPKVGVIKKKPGISVNVNNGQPQQGNGSMVVTVTPVHGGPKIEDEKAAENQRAMRNIASPTQANDQELPEWFGHSLASPVHGNAAKGNESPWDIFGFDDGNNNQNGYANANANNGSGIKTPGTPNVQYAPETPHNKKRRNSQPKASTPGGLIAPPRQGNRSKSPKSKTRPSSPNNPNDANDDPFYSFGQANASIEKDQSGGPSGSSTPVLDNDEHGHKKKDRKKRKAKKSYDKEDDEPANDKVVKQEVKPPKKKRHKTDAIAQMKRGTAMLKYGRHGFPHFRRFQLSRDNRRLLWYSRKKSLAETHIEIKDIKDVLEGQQTEVFKQCTQRTLKKASFSVIYGLKLKTLDVVAKSQEEAQLWTKGLKGLMKANKVGKLHKVVQILVDVPYVDITKPKGKEPTRDPNSKQQFSAELIQTIEHTLRESKKTFELIVKLADSKNVLKSSEYENVSVLVSELEQRLNEVETGLNQKNVDFIELKRDVWVLKVDVTVLEEKLKVLSKGGSAMYL